MLYWVTETFPRCIYPYIDFFGRGDASTVFHSHPDYYCKKPIGYSYFPFELGPVPLAWAKTTGDVVWHRAHEAVSSAVLFKANTLLYMSPPQDQSPHHTSSYPPQLY